MKKALLLLLVTLMVLLLMPSGILAATDGTYSMYQIESDWDGTNALRTVATTIFYDYSYGDEESITYDLPWQFTIYGVNYSQITADTNGNIWFSATDAAHSYDLADTERGPVIAAWNNDLSSYYYGGVFIQHKSDPERVVVEWQAETYTEEGTYAPNQFEAVLYQNGSVRLNYADFNASVANDFGSGISQGDGATYISVTDSYGSPYTLSGTTYGIGGANDEAITITSGTSTETSAITLTGTMLVGSTISISTDATIGEITYPTPTTWSVEIYGLESGDNTIIVTATSAIGQETPVTTTVSYAGGESIPVPAAGPLGVISVMAVLTLIGLKFGLRFREC